MRIFWASHKVRFSRMDESLKKTVIQLTTGDYIHFTKIKRYTKFGYEALFKDSKTQKYLHVAAYSRPLLQLNGLATHLQEMVKMYQCLNSKIVAQMYEVVRQKEMTYLVSEGYQHTLADLAQRREGLTQYEATYFLVDLLEIMNYLRNRDCLFEKIQLDDIYLNASLKPAIPFNIFFNAANRKSVLRKLPFRQETRNTNNCPDLFTTTLHEPQAVNSWNIGIILFEILTNSLPFSSQEESTRKDHNLRFARDVSTEARDLLRKLLHPEGQKRLKCSLIMIQPLLKKYPCVPHILPSTIFWCPPSEHYREEHAKAFNAEIQSEETQMAGVKKDIHSEILLQRDTDEINQPPVLQTLKELKSSERTLSDKKVFMEEWVDISNTYGYGYQMSTGTVCFVFNDQTQYYYPNGNTRIIVARNRRKAETIYSYEKFPEEEEVKKKIFILEAFTKSLKRYKAYSSQSEKTVTVQAYSKTKHAALFQLSNDSVQVFFTDKVCFLLSRNGVYLQDKNSDKFDKIDSEQSDPDRRAREDYCLSMASKIFKWEIKGCATQQQITPLPPPPDIYA